MSVLRGVYTLKNEEESSSLAVEIAKSLKPENVLTFAGNLGSGKTFFSRQIIKTLCGNNTTVISPTFNLLQIYSAKQFDIYHFDLYRLKYAEEVFELGIEEAFSNNLCLIEWPEIISHLLPKDTISIQLEIIDQSTRLCTIN
jgi:tRNA threonylcarbamoyladenosine biosynthesis protein TsaE